jgi:LysM repeat protein
MSYKFVRNVIISSIIIFFGLAITPVISSELINQIGLSQKDVNQPVTHTVEKGETVYSIAKKYDLSVDNIYKLNPDAVSGITEGQNLIVSNPKLKKGTKVYNYTVQPKETIYGISKQFGISADELVNQNPELKTKALTEGQVLRISTTKEFKNSIATPNKTARFLEHKVMPKETIYGISKQYGTTPETLISFNPELKNTLKIGSTILVPISSDSLIAQTSLLDINAIKIGVVLPFVNQSSSQGARFLEYYEGLLLSLQDLKAKGFTANIFVFDMGSETGITKLNSLLETNELKNLDLLIGGVSNDQISILSNFTQRYGIKYVMPFPTTSTVVNTNPYAFQVSENQTSLITSVSKAFVNKFSNSNVIFITSQGDKSGFVKDMTSQLTSVGLTPRSVVSDSNLATSLTSALDSKRKNVIVVTSGSMSVLQNVLPVLNTIKTQQPATNITLFGQPEWQTYPQYIDQYSKFDTYIYTSFFLNDADYATSQFVTNYKNWYNNKSMINTYPKYAALGYDTGLFFFSALMKYGKNFEGSLSLNTTQTIQTPFAFKKVNSTGGYLNTGFYFVHYVTDNTIQKIAFAQW